MEQDVEFMTFLEADDGRDHTGDKAVFKERFDQLQLEMQRLGAEIAQAADEQKEPDALVAAVQEQQQIAMMGKQGQADEELGDDEQGECYDEEHGYFEDGSWVSNFAFEEAWMAEGGFEEAEEDELMPDEEEEQLMPDEEEEEEEQLKREYSMRRRRGR